MKEVIVPDEAPRQVIVPDEANRQHISRRAGRDDDIEEPPVNAESGLNKRHQAQNDGGGP